LPWAGLFQAFGLPRRHGAWKKKKTNTNKKKNPMNAPHLALAPLPRRTFLRGLGVTLALPLLECMRPAFSRATAAELPRRMLLISNNLGVLPKPFFPATAGRDYELSPYLSALADFRNDFTVFSGLSHPGVVGGHSTENCFLTAARGPTRSGFRNSISLDQFAAEKLGQLTRFSTLNLGVNIDKANRSLSWTRDGVLLPAEDSASALFRKMFVQGDRAEVDQQLRRLEERGSILDTLRDDARAVSAQPRERRPRLPRPVFHLRARGRGAAALRARMGTAPQARDHRAHARGHSGQETHLPEV